MENKKINKICILLLISLSLIYIILPYPSTNLRSASYPDIDKYITSKMEELRIPGISLGLINKDDIYLKGYGKSDSFGTSVTEDTPFILGSTTKSITSVAVMQLVEQGKINLDQPIIAYLPDFKFKNVNESNKITIRQLLNQTSGIAGSTGGSDYLNEESTGKDFVGNLANDNLLFSPGECYEYAEAYGNKV